MLLFYFVILFYWVCGCMNRASPWNNKINCYFYMIPTLYKECQGNKLWWNFGDSFWFKTNLYRIEDCSRAGKLPLHWLLARYTKTLLVIILFTGQLLITLSFIINRPVSGVWKWGGKILKLQKSWSEKCLHAQQKILQKWAQYPHFLSYRKVTNIKVYVQSMKLKNVLTPQNLVTVSGQSAW